MEIVIVNANEAIVVSATGRMFRLYSGHGQVRALVLDYLVPLSARGNCGDYTAYNRAVVAAECDTTVVNMDELLAG
jgi:hypothetical protein